MKEEIKKLILADKIADAKRMAFAAVSEFPDAEIYLLIGSIYAIDGNKQLAIQYYNRAYDMDGENYEVVSTMCDFLIANGDKQSANEIMERFIRQQTEIPELDTGGAVTSSETGESQFDYTSFILGGGDAIAFDPSDEFAFMQKESHTDIDNDSVYSDLIFGSLEEVLQKHDLPKINNEKILSPVFHSDREAITSNKKLKILFTMFGWNESGGGTTHPKSVCIELVRRGYDVAVFYAAAMHPINSTPYFMEETTDNGVKLFGVYNRATIFLDADNPEREICDEKVVNLFKDVLNRFIPDVIHFNNFLGLSFEIATIAREAGIPSCFTPHNYHLLDPKLYIYNQNLEVWRNTNFFENSELVARFPYKTEDYHKRQDKAKSILVNDITSVLCVSSRQKELLTEFVGDDMLAEEKFIVVNQIPKSVTLLSEKRQSKPVVLQSKRAMTFCFIGDGIPHKGAHIIAQALQYIPDKDINVNMWGNFNEEYERALKKVDIGDRIHFKGVYTSETLPHIAAENDILLVPSICEETGPLVVPEGLAMGLPVIGAKIGGIPDFIIDGYNGMLYSHNSPKALASVMRVIIENPFKLEYMQRHTKLNIGYSDYISQLELIYLALKNGEVLKGLELRFCSALDKNHWANNNKEKIK